ncbi:DUF2268 domain-containing putative Zn-dependent protease [Virgibacillus halophilus]|uniref:DUF2268 domain-containing putative Zn-dependent protease n=1 Tax=Tigheibacillus halophilus TaxID=361280 RepID=A0ABU5CAC7_9BACI|nr:DUF2268 domain-containing putative Zn-dependent protease [Virgibacillus halophilus]
MEGLAEHAVSEQVGKAHLAGWTSYYSSKQLDGFWKKWVKPNKDLPKFRHKHFDLLFGTGLYPKMLGYCVGYFLVEKYIQKHKSSSKELLHTPSYQLAGGLMLYTALQQLIVYATIIGHIQIQLLRYSILLL